MDSVPVPVDEQPSMGDYNRSGDVEAVGTGAQDVPLLVATVMFVMIVFTSFPR